MIAIRIGAQPGTRITMRNVLNARELAVTELLDLTREAATLVATAIAGIGDPFGIHGFASEGGHDVHC